MAEFRLARSGTGQLVFDGELLAFACGKDLWPADKKGQPHRYHNLGLYRSKSGRYVVTIAFRCKPKHDDPYDEAEAFDTPQEVLAYLNDFDPVEGVRGWPGNDYREQDRRLRGALTSSFETLVSQVLAGRDEFAEMV